MRGDALKGHLDLLLLAILADGPAHGYAVIEQLRRRSSEAFDLPEGTVYPALHRLERSGFIESRWDASAARRRRVYALSPSGGSALAERRSEWRGFQAAVDAVVGGTT
jgi:DNA-binding PadR family transcriptional regulator